MFNGYQIVSSKLDKRYGGLRTGALVESHLLSFHTSKGVLIHVWHSVYIPQFCLCLLH